MYCMYFVRLNLFLQRDEPIISVLHEQVFSDTNRMYPCLIYPILDVASVQVCSCEGSDVVYQDREAQLEGM